MPNSLAVAHAPPMRERRDIARSTGHALLSALEQCHFGASVAITVCVKGIAVVSS